VQKSLDALLDLKQKQANLTEAKFTRQQAQDSAKQTDTVVVFTVVTIVFVSFPCLLSFRIQANTNQMLLLAPPLLPHQLICAENW
jgi:hypothetical protein